VKGLPINIVITAGRFYANGIKNELILVKKHIQASLPKTQI
jgi:hypothetical protein